MKYSLNYDLGTNSIGWALLALDNDNNPVSIIDSGVRIFSDSLHPKDKASLASKRREKRSQRRNLDRSILRRKDLVNVLIENKLMPVDKKERKKLENLNPYLIRSRAIKEQVSLYEIGRAVFHINQGRGFKSNRISNSLDDEGKVKDAIFSSEKQMREKKCITYGELCYKLLQEKKPVKSRFGKEGLFPARYLLEDEFDKIFAKQSTFYSSLTNDVKNKIKNTVFRQRPLKPVFPGFCSLETQEFRAPTACIEFQEFKIKQNLSHLRVNENSLNTEDKKRLYLELINKKSLTDKQIKKILNLKPEDNINFEKIDGNSTSSLIIKFLKNWQNIPVNKQKEIIWLLLKEQDEDKLINILKTYNFNDTEISVLKSINFPRGYSNLSLKAINNILPKFDGSDSYFEAAKLAGYVLDKKYPLLSYLPYYASLENIRPFIGTGTNNINDHDEIRFGKIANPVVHRCLNQLRLLTNAIIKKHGKPKFICVELARELKLSKKQKKELIKTQSKNKKEKDKIIEFLNKNNIIVNRDNINKMKLYYSLPKKECIYSGAEILEHEVLTNKFQIDHIIPISSSLDDSLSNLVLCTNASNRAKSNKTPYQAFNNLNGYSWPDIEKRLNYFAENSLDWKKKKEKFAFKNIDEFERSDFLSRHLSDTAYISRVAAKYLSCIVDEHKVKTVKGVLVGQFRYAWNLNSIINNDKNLKNRLDHRHHAIDAIVLGCITNSMISKFKKEKNTECFWKNIKKPWESFYDDVKKSINSIIVSHKKEHGTNGKIFEDTAYGIVKNKEKPVGLVSRTPIENLTTLAKINKIIDKSIRDKIAKEINNSTSSIPDILSEFSKNNNIKKIRILSKDQTAVTIYDKQGIPYKKLCPGGIHHINIYERDGKWLADRVYFHQLKYEKKPNNFVIKLHKDDCVQIIENGQKRIIRISKLDGTANRIFYTEHNQILNKKEKETEPQFSFNKLKNLNACLLHVDVMGRCFPTSRNRKTK